jgi:hypothetical protein
MRPASFFTEVFSESGCRIDREREWIDFGEALKDSFVRRPLCLRWDLLGDLAKKRSLAI